jgi:hypothetical protein
MDKYLGIVEEELFDRLGRPSFFDELVEMILRRIREKIQICASGAPQESGDGILELSAAAQLKNS